MNNHQNECMKSRICGNLLNKKTKLCIKKHAFLLGGREVPRKKMVKFNIFTTSDDTKSAKTRRLEIPSEIKFHFLAPKIWTKCKQTKMAKMNPIFTKTRKNENYFQNSNGTCWGDFCIKSMYNAISLRKIQTISRNILTIHTLYAKIGIVKVIFILFEK